MPENKSYVQAALTGAASWLINKLVPVENQDQNVNVPTQAQEIKPEPQIIGLLPEIERSDGHVDTSFTYGNKTIGGVSIGYVKVLSVLSRHIETETLLKIAEDLYLLSDKKMGAYSQDIQAAGEFLGLIALKRKEKGQ